MTKEGGRNTLFAYFVIYFSNFSNEKIKYVPNTVTKVHEKHLQ